MMLMLRLYSLLLLLTLLHEDVLQWRRNTSVGPRDHFTHFVEVVTAEQLS